MPIILIIFLVLFVITVVVLIVHVAFKGKGLAQHCSTDADCPRADICVPNPEMNNKKQCIAANTKFCKITPMTDLTECKFDSEDTTFSENKKCRRSPNGCSECLNTPNFSCIEVTDDCPYTWVQDGKKITLPNSPTGAGWCLPNVSGRQTCNQFTSEYIMVETGENEYEWGCYCKYPNLFDHSEGPLSTCTLVRACDETNPDGPLGQLVVPTSQKCKEPSDCKSGLCLKPKTPAPCGDLTSVQFDEAELQDTGEKFCHVPWIGDVVDQIDPLTGQCVCNSGFEYQCVQSSPEHIQMTCRKSTCLGFPVKTDGCLSGSCASQPLATCCDCPTGYIRCPDDVNQNNASLCLYCHDTGPTCIPDPCKTIDVPDGYYDKEKKACICPGLDNVAFPNEDSSVGEICVHACKANGPCSTRGSCYLPPKATAALCCNCQCPWESDGQNPGGTCTCDTYSGRNKSGDECNIDSDCCSNNCKCTSWNPPSQGGGCSGRTCVGSNTRITNPCATGHIGKPGYTGPSCVPHPPAPPTGPTGPTGSSRSWDHWEPTYPTYGPRSYLF
jgi:hypothetical protein